MGTVELHGTPFVRKMAEVLWHIDGLYAKLEAQQAPIPECLVVSTFGDFLMF